MGYTPVQIDIIYNFDGSAEQLSRIGGTLSFSITADLMSFDPATNKAHARLTVDFNWTTQPLVKFTDIIGIAWNGPMTRTAQVASIQYVHMSTGGSSYYDPNCAQVVNPSGPLNAGVGLTIPMRGSGVNFDTHYAKSGMFRVILETQGHLNFAAYAAYGHKTLNLLGGPSLSIPGGLSISFSPSIEISTEGQDWTQPVYI